MATAPISAAQLYNASDDAQDYAVVVNGGPTATTVNRVGNTLRSLSNLEQLYLDSIRNGTAANPRGAWAPNTAYALNDGVTFDGVFYVALSAFTSGATFAADLAQGRWDVRQGATLEDLQAYVEKVDYTRLNGTLDPRNNNSVAGMATTQCSWVGIFDSFGDAVGATSYREGCAWKIGRSLCNANDNGVGGERGFGYHSIVNWNTALASGLFTTTGTVVDRGMVRTQLRLNAGQSVTMTGVAIDYADLVYDAAGGSGTITIARNGVTARTVAFSGTGPAATFDGTTITSGVLTAESDTITFTASATVYIMTVHAWRRAGNSPIGYMATLGGTGYQDYTSTAALDEIAFYLNYGRTGAPKYLFLALGTNNIYNSGKALGPADMLAQVLLIIEGINSRVSGTKFIMQVPAKAGDDWPFITPGFTYEDYVEASVNFAATYDIALARHDQTVLGTGDTEFLDPDQLHLRNAGHQVYAKTWCDTLGVPFNDSIKARTVAYSIPADIAAAAGNVTEADWLPQLFGTGGAGSFTYAIQKGHITQIGTTYIITFDLQIASVVSAPAGDTAITGMGVGPAEPSGSGSISLYSGLTLLSGYTQVTCNMAGNGTPTMYLFQLGSGQGISGISVANVGVGTRISGTVTFNV